ncbi:CAF1-domain-containing protein [Pyrenochaeta sp. DS3sAY3a]|nr:CAF1-domain-containing protein [Pyrenochaeta sp. DS3sAY3a]
MEVDAASFPYHLLGLFIDISEADFVSFDLEFSGIPSRLPNKSARRPGRCTLEERYAETKEGADRYQILQVGITCARFDYIANKYVLRPYNINISPLLDERLDFEREISFQSGACTFLLNNGFNLGAPFATGVQYLSREEAELAKQLAVDRVNKKNNVDDLQLRPEDVDSLDFVRRVRDAIAAWETTLKSSLDITTHTGLEEEPSIQVISRFEKRLVHQLVRAEFPKLVTMSRTDCIRIIHFDSGREEDNKRRILKRVKEQIIRQTGFRWVFEALVQGSDFDHAHPLFAATSSGLPDMATEDIKRRYERAVGRLRDKKPVLVGHNMFTDIVYLYRTFVGQLPDTLQGFQDAIHEMFPRIIDTKYLATHDEGDLNASPTLQEIAEGLSQQPLPTIVTHIDHSKYNNTESFHEAGYDSLLTATIMLRLAAKLSEAHTPDKPIQSIPASNGHSNGLARSGVRDSNDLNRNVPEKISGPVPLPPLEDPRRVELTQLQKVPKHKTKNKNKKSSKGKKPQGPRFQSKNMFDELAALQLAAEADADSTSSLDEKSTPEAIMWDEAEASTAAATSWEDEVPAQDTTGWVPIEQKQRQPMEMIPGFDDEFWNEFGNRLRVFGTREGMFRVGEWVW